MPPGHTAADLTHNLGAVIGSPALWSGLFVTAGLFVGAPRLLVRLPLGFHEAGPARVGRALLPFAAGLAVLPLAWFLEPVFFRCPLPAVGLATIPVGALSSAWRLGALRIPDRPPLRPLLVALAVVLPLAALVWGWPSAQGDEPHYLLVAESLATDGDLDLARDYVGGDYRPFHPAPLSPHYKPGLVPGSRYSMHGVGYPVTLLPATVMASTIDGLAVVPVARVLQVLVYGVFVALLFGMLRDRVGERAALYGTLAAAGLTPLVFAPLHLFPESLVMLAALAGYRQLAESRGSWWVGGILVACLPWLAVKTIPFALVLALGAPFVAGRPTPRRVALAAAPLVGSLLLHATFTLWLYGTLSPSALYLGSDPGFGRQPGLGAGLGPYLADWTGALRTFVGYWIDQKEGLFFTGPHWLLAAGGIPWVWRHRRREVIVLSLALLAYLGPYALSQQIGGQSPPARPLMAVLWILALPLAVGLTALARAAVAGLRGVLLVCGATLTVIFAADPTLLPHDYPVTSSSLIRSLSPHGAEFTRYFPLWLNVREAWPALVSLAWLGLAALLIAGCVRGTGPLPGGHARPQRAGWLGATVAALAMAGLGLWAATLVVTDRHVGTRGADGVTTWVVYSLPEGAWAEASGAWVSGGRATEVVITANPPLAGARIGVRSLVPQTVRVSLPTREVSVATGSGWQRFHWEAPGGPGHGDDAWLFEVEAEVDVSPAELAGGDDHRRLGALLAVRRSAGDD